MAAVIRGLAVNPAAPIDVLVRLLDVHGADLRHDLCDRRSMPAELVEVMLHHPTPRVRAALAANLHVDLRVRVRLINDPEPTVLCALRHDPRLPLPPDAVDALLDAYPRASALGLLAESEAVEELTFELSDDARLRTPAARHPNPLVRAAAARLLERLTPEERDALRADTAPIVRRTCAREEPAPITAADLLPGRGLARWARLQQPLAADLVAQLLAADDADELRFLAINPFLPADLLLTHPSPDVRSAVAGRRDLTARQLTHLITDPHPLVRNTVSVHPALTEEQRAAIDVDLSLVPGDFGPRRPTWTRTSDQVAAWARSSNVLLRRWAAAAPELPPALVPVLATDRDLGVRTLLATNNIHADPALLLRSYLEYTGKGRDTLPAKPGFPGRALARHASDDDPALRRLAALDPDVAPDVLVALLADPDPAVRTAAAASPRLPAHHVVRLLDEPSLARAAAANPALPVETMWRLANHR